MLSHGQLFMTPWTPEPSWLLCPWNFPGKNTGAGCHSYPRGSSRPRDRTCISECLLHWQADFFTTEPPGKPAIQSVLDYLFYIDWCVYVNSKFRNLFSLSHLALLCPCHRLQPSHGLSLDHELDWLKSVDTKSPNQW